MYICTHTESLYISVHLLYKNTPGSVEGEGEMEVVMEVVTGTSALLLSLCV